MKTYTKHITAALFTTAILTSSLFADAPLPQRPDYSATLLGAASHTSARPRTVKTAHTIAVFTQRQAQSPAPAPRLSGNIGNGHL